MNVSMAHPRRVLADTLPGRRVRNLALVLSAATIVGISAQVAIPLPFTPVPISLATLPVLLAGATLGPARGGMAMLTYLAAGVAGVPWFSQQATGWDFPSFGYIIGFVIASVVVGALARRGGDRTVVGAGGIMLAGSLLIYAAGVPWLMWSIDVGISQALALGVVPFLIGDAIKLVIAAVLMPSAWKVVDYLDGR